MGVCDGAVSGERSEVMFSIGRRWRKARDTKSEGSECDRSLTIIFKEAIWNMELIVYHQ